MLPSVRPVHRRSKSRRSSLKSTLKCSLVAVTLCLGVSSFSGCMTVHNGWEAITNNGSWNDTVVVLRNRSFSKRAWHRREHHFCKQAHQGDFCAGFRAGYEAVAAGADGCTPAFPPQEYWSWEYQSAEGQARTSAWFAGYPHGCRAAEEDGVSNWNQIQMSAGMQAEYQQVGTFEHEGALYPIPDQNAVVTPPQPAEQVIQMTDMNGRPFVLPEGAELIPQTPPTPQQPPATPNQ